MAPCSYLLAARDELEPPFGSSRRADTGKACRLCTEHRLWAERSTLPHHPGYSEAAIHVSKEDISKGRTPTAAPQVTHRLATVQDIAAETSLPWLTVRALPPWRPVPVLDRPHSSATRHTRQRKWPQVEQGEQTKCSAPGDACK